MRRLLAAITAVCLLGATAPANHNAFGVAVLQRLSPQSHDANVFIWPVSLGHLAKSLHSAELEVEMPRFTARYSAGLNGILQSMGMRLAFDGSADFSPMCGCRPGSIAIDSVLHKTYVQLDETDTTATVAMAIAFHMMAIHPVPKPLRTFIVNKPFLFAIRDEHTGALLFIGVINSISRT